MVEWLPARLDLTPGAIAVDAQYNGIQLSLDDPVSSELYDSGAIVGGSVFLRLDTAVAGAGGRIEWILWILPPGRTIPTLTSDSALKSEEDLIWMRGLLEISPYPQAGVIDLKLNTKRSYKKGAILVLTVINRGTAAWGAGSTARAIFDLYLQETG